MKVDICIVNYRGAHDTLQALARLTTWRKGAVWVVDNSAHEPEMQAQSATLTQACACPGLQLLQAGGNLGFGQGCNLAFERSSAEYFLLLNPDARIATADIELLAQSLHAMPGWGAVSPTIYWNEQHSFVLPLADPQTPGHTLGLALRSHAPALARFLAQRAVQRCQQQMASDRAFEVPCLAGAVMLVRRSAVMAAGGLFDPAYFMFFEDADLSRRLRRAGFKLALVPQCTAVHEYRHKAYKAALMAPSQQHYFRTHFPHFYRWSRALERVAAISRPVVQHTWFDVLPGPIQSAQEFTHRTDGAGVLAWSPSLSMVPALTRPWGFGAHPLDAQEWALLEPGAYVALLRGRRRWIYFERG